MQAAHLPAVDGDEPLLDGRLQARAAGGGQPRRQVRIQPQLALRAQPRQQQQQCSGYL